MSNVPEDLVKKARSYADKHGVPWNVGKAIINQESAWDPKAKSKAGAMGLMQLMPKVASALGVTDPYDVDQNLDAGMSEIGGHLRRHKGNLADALADYNYGQGNVKKARAAGRPLPDETIDYQRKVIKGAAWDGKETVDAVGMPVANQAPPTPTAGLVRRADGLLVHPKYANDAEASYSTTAVPTDGVDPTTAAIADQNTDAAAEGLAIAKTFADGEADAADVWANTWKNSVTQQLIDGFNTERDPNWKVTDAHKQALEKDGMLAGDPERFNRIVNKAGSEAQFQDLRASWNEDREFSRRMANVVGEDKRNGLMALGIGSSLADPAMLGAGLLGAAMLPAKAGMIASLVVDTAASAALTAVAREQVMQEYTAKDLAVDTMFGAAFTGIGHAFGKGVDAVRAHKDAQAAKDNVDDGGPEAVPEPVEPTLPAQGAVEPIDDAVPSSPKELAQSLGGDTADNLEGHGGIEEDVGESVDVDGVDDHSRMLSRRRALENKPNPLEGSPLPYDTNPLTRGVKPVSDDPKYHKLLNAGVLMEVDSPADLAALSKSLAREGVPEDVRAVYLPERDAVAIVRSAVQPGENVRGLVMHEVGVHYGLERSVGTKRFLQITDAIAKSDTPEAKASRGAVPEDTPAHLRDEEAVGYLAERHGDTPLAKRVVSMVRNFLRENIPLFDRMKITDADALEYIRGALKGVARRGKAGTKDVDGFVWHGSAVSGIDKLDTAYAKQGINNSFYGWGNYVSSDRFVAFSYLKDRLNLARKAGLPSSPGAMYRLKLKAKPEDMIQWERPMAGSAVEAKVAGTSLAARPGETGRQYLGRIEKLFNGDQKAAAEALWAAGVPGVRHATGFSRGLKNRYDSNYVLFHNDALDMAVRYSRQGKPVAEAQTPHALQLAIKTQQLVSDIMSKPEPATKGHEAVAETTRKYMRGLEGKEGGVLQATREAFMGMGTRGAMSESKVVRVLMGDLVEDMTGSAKWAGETAASLAGKVKAQALAMLRPLDGLLADCLTKEEKAQIILGADATARVDRAVFRERALRRNAHLSNTPYQPVDAAAAKVADLMDDVYGFLIDEAAARGSRHANKIRAQGVRGYTDYSWNSAMMMEWHATDTLKWNSLLDNLKNQYLTTTLRPAINALIAKGHTAVSAMQAMEARAQYLVSNKLSAIMRGGSSFDLNRISFTAEELLADLQAHGHTGQALTDKFQKDLADVLADRSRHEMDLVREVNGVSLMDVMDFSAEGSMHSGIGKFSGLAGLASKGVRDELDMEIRMTAAATSQGVHPDDLTCLRLVFHQLGMTDPTVKGTSQWLTTAKTLTGAAMLGKRVFSTILDFTSIAIHHASLLKTSKAMIDGIQQNPALVQQFRDLDPDLVGEGWVVESKNLDLDPAGRADRLSTVNRLAKRGARLNSLLSLHRTVNAAMKRGVLRLSATEILSSIASAKVDANGNITTISGLGPSRLAALGLDPATIRDIQVAWPGHRLYKSGEAIPFAQRGKALEPHMLPYELSEKLQTAITRQCDKAMPNSRWVGEQTEKAVRGDEISSVLMQFLHNSFTAHSKVLIQGMAHDKWNALGMMTLVGIPAGLAVYHLRVAASTLGMGDEEKAAYEEKALSGKALVMGVMNASSAFGMVGTTASWVDQLMGGIAEGQTPAALLGYAGKVSQVGGAVKDYMFEDEDGPQTTVKDIGGAVSKVLPGGTTILSTILYNNALKNEE